MRLLGGIFADHGERDLSWTNVLQTFAAGNQFAIRRKDRGNADDIACRDTGVAQRQLETGKSFAMFSDALGEEDLLSDERHSAGLWCLRNLGWAKKSSAEEN